MLHARNVSTLSLSGAVFVFKTRSYADSERARDAGFHFSAPKQIFFTSSLQVAARLREYADSKASKEINRYFIDIEPWRLPLPSPSEKAQDHQRVAIRFALERNRSYLALDPGLGKTFCAAAVASVLCDRTIYVTPPFLVENIKAEMRAWAPKLRVAVYSPKADAQALTAADVLIVPDTYLARAGLAALINSVGRFEERTMVVDEAQRYKNKTSKRTKVLLGGAARLGLVDLCERTVYMSGTPMPNRPLELYTVLSKAAPETIDFMSEFKYAVTYCDAYKGRFGWDFRGASNVAQLAERVKAPTGPFMLRIRKSVLKLPPKVEELFVLTGKPTKEITSIEKLLKKKYRSADDLMRSALAASAGTDDLHVSSYRRLLGDKKAQDILPYLVSLLEDTKERLIIFAFHLSAIEILKAGLAEYSPMVITGKTPKGKRHEIVQEFQSQKNRRPLIGNYMAMGIGLTLTAADREIFVEFDWVPGVNDQASDRAHRIGQTKSILVQFAVYADSLDKSVIEAHQRKRKAINLV